MRSLLFLLFFFGVLGKTSKYYSSCSSGAPKSGMITYSDCKEYASGSNHCCLLYYVSNPDIQINYNFYFKTADTTEKETQIRKLSERVNLCFGLSEDGYDNIEDVIDELEDESGLDEININCSSKILNLNIIILVIFFILF